MRKNSVYLCATSLYGVIVCQIKSVNTSGKGIIANTGNCPILYCYIVRSYLICIDRIAHQRLCECIRVVNAESAIDCKCVLKCVINDNIVYVCIDRHCV